MTNKQISLPIILSVVGHTNTGKTSLVRTLMRNSDFGEIDNRAGTTRHVESAQIFLGDKAFLELRDTPGLEDSVALAERLQALTSAHLSGRDTLLTFVKDSANKKEFDQELKVLNQILISDIILYVIDCREPVLEKYLFELRCLSMAAKPIIPVLNFIEKSGNHKTEWRKTLADFNFHSLVEFDTVAFSFEAEKRLYRKFQTVLEPYYALLETFIQQREEDWLALRHACIQCSSEFMLAVSKIQVTVDTTTADKNAEVEASARLQNTVRVKEKEQLGRILQLLQFSADDIQYANVPIKDGRWILDLFAPEALKKFGIDTASAAATGAAIGVGVDVMLAGLSLGTATLAGAILGSSWSTGKRFGKQLLARYRGQYVIGLDQPTITLLLARQAHLLDALFHRGHAAQQQLMLGDDKVTKLDYSEPLQVLKKVQNLAVSDDEELEADIKQVLNNWFTTVISA